MVGGSKSKVVLLCLATYFYAPLGRPSSWSVWQDPLSRSRKDYMEVIQYISSKALFWAVTSYRTK